MGRGSAQGRCASALPESLAEEEIRRRADCESAVLCGVPRVIHGCSRTDLFSIGLRSRRRRRATRAAATRSRTPPAGGGRAQCRGPGGRGPHTAESSRAGEHITRIERRAVAGPGRPTRAPRSICATKRRGTRAQPPHHKDTFDIAQKNQLRRQSRVDVITRSTGPSQPTPWKHPALPVGGNAGGSPQRAKTQRRV